MTGGRLRVLGSVPPGRVPRTFQRCSHVSALGSTVFWLESSSRAEFAFVFVFDFEIDPGAQPVLGSSARCVSSLDRSSASVCMRTVSRRVRYVAIDAPGARQICGAGTIVFRRTYTINPAPAPEAPPAAAAAAIRRLPQMHIRAEALHCRACSRAGGGSAHAHNPSLPTSRRRASSGVHPGEPTPVTAAPTMSSKYKYRTHPPRRRAQGFMLP